MPGPGFAPKPPEQRRRRNKPARGEWVTIRAPAKPVLPTLSQIERGPWAPRTRRLWNAWRADPATSTYGPAEVAAAIELAYLTDQAVTTGHPRPGELRLWMDGLGLTPKGKQDRRWRTVEEAEEAAQAAQAVPDEVANRRRQRHARVRAVDHDQADDEQ